jgi:L-lactate dehydrogenase complex protein LldE
MATCLCDTFFDEVARATVEVLEHLGCDVTFPREQTCCGQPAFNGGDWEASRKVVRHTVKTFRGNRPVVVPSGSCAAMIFHGAPLEFEKEEDCAAVADLANRTWELADFIVNGLGVKRWPGRFPKRVALHRSCHSRGTDSAEAAACLLGSIEGLELVAFGEGEQCCGFGGTFSVSFPNLSASMGRDKIDNVLEAKPDVLVSADMGCLLHLGGIVDREGKSLRRMHLAEVLCTALHGES